ncbi:PIG-M-domain-containing protein [Hyaloraphidium curvatum]|nr:PIG-M-domain-containing protein [Hyaloraphidium curvatum]
MATRCLVLAAGLRIALLLYGLLQDRTPLKYTDIDYFVFTDAATFVANGESPYLRETYRYTPLLAWILVPNATLFAAWGKVLFAALDLACGSLVATILEKRGMGPSRAMWSYASLILLNPFIATISTRGSAEAVVNFLVIATFYLFLERRTFLASFTFGLAVHVKIYPILYALPILVMLDGDYSTGSGPSKLPRPQSWGLRGILNRQRIAFGLTSGLTFFALTAIMFAIYGEPFLNESLLYHVGRKDHRHNFSVYFYSIYLDYDRMSSAAAMLPFVTQLLLAGIIGLKFGRDLGFACFLQTVAFVAFNKVSTSQYFVWYLALLPLAAPSIQLAQTWKTGLWTLAGWIASQAIWLWRAYRLELLGENAFRSVFGSGLLFFWAHCAVLVYFIRSSTPRPWFDRGRISAA